jgi:LemA protein
MAEKRSGLGTVTKIVLGILLIAAIIISLFAGKYNSLVRDEERVNTEFSNISVQLQRRNDLIPNLVNTVKAYAAHETEVFTSVTNARERMMNANTMEGTIAADAEVTASLGRLLAIAEAYPQLRANENFLSLQDQLEGTENRISTARRDYNTAVNSFNAKLRSFPTNIIGGMFGFEKHSLFAAQEGAETVPEVNFD